MRKIFLIILFAVSIAGCATISADMESWEGHHMNELIAKWGYPSRMVPDGKGGQILVYEITSTYTTPGYSNTYGNAYGNTYGNNTYVYGNSRTTYTPPQTHTRTKTRTFYVNQSGIVYGWEWQGL